MEYPDPHDPLFGTEVEDAIASIPRELDPLGVAERLRGRLGPELGRRAAVLLELRLRSKRRFPEGWIPFLTRKGLEQATPHAVATDRADQLRAVLGPSRIWDASCGVGSDLLAISHGGAAVGSDVEPTSVRFAAENLRRRGASSAVVRADAGCPPWRRGAAAAVLIDPDRRPAGPREGDPEAWGPPLSRALELAQDFGAGCVKLPPAHDPAALAGLGALRWVSLDGELRELSLWTGAVAEDRPRREAVALRSDGGCATFVAPLDEVAPLDPAAAAAVGWLAEPDPAVVRAGLVGALAARVGLAPLGPRIAYLGGGHEPRAEGLLRSWRVLGTAPLDRRRVRALLAEHDVGPVTVKKRGHPDPADVLARRLRGTGSQQGLLAVARLERGHLALLLQP